MVRFNKSLRVVSEPVSSFRFYAKRDQVACRMPRWLLIHYSNSVARRPSRQPPLNRRVGHLPVGQDRSVIYGPSRYVIRDKNLQVNFFFFTFEEYRNLIGTIDFYFFFYFSFVFEWWNLVEYERSYHLSCFGFVIPALRPCQCASQPKWRMA